MNRLWSRLGVRALSVGLLAAGLGGGLYLGHGQDDQQQSSQATLVAQANAEEIALLKQREADHAAARAYRRTAEDAAAEKAAGEARQAAANARKLEVKVIADAAATKKAADAKKAASGGAVPYAGHIPSSCNDFSGSRQIGCALMLDAGFKIDQFPCLDKLWKRESGWNYSALNKSSQAYGIPQALPGRKMAKFGADWESNPATQIKWGLDYIEGRYSSPCGAWGHSQEVGWY
ncbi:hypothetical protein ACWT_7577 [Actinoplanes sp. SE50]|uniref:aggregation-promoting factor C-terminal-like domain-containing protein n=1 Tax=unclassified Actinoplanes TaxID=2626549 RepID=UPI00023EDD39|nr:MULTISPECIES: hypothetical protein [unclassified Actinoplanes]AEV88587.1 hypothetical protein ACPL_7707 [Actinoplanes sp. SE50/110]ATO86992.1 hypothetical protein ACWT_7577 [Actinoplanes sp. SE50]SLM04410.1 uncharacterized protein ACSP50_7715 [Actinoplanes sp. SE50/110]